MQKAVTKERMGVNCLSLWTKCNNNSKGLEWKTIGTNSTTAATADKNNTGHLQTRILCVNEFVKLILLLYLCQFIKNKHSQLLMIVALPPIFVEHIEGNHSNYTQNRNKIQAQIVTDMC